MAFLRRRGGRRAAGLLVTLLATAATAGRPVLVRVEGGGMLLTDRPDPDRPTLPGPGARAAAGGALARGMPPGSARVPFEGMIREAAAAAGLDPALVIAVVRRESAFDPRAVSTAGARGLMQLMPATAERFGVSDPFDPAENLRGGTRYLRWLLEKFQGDLALSLAAYHAGEGAVQRSGGMPPYEDTQVYVRQVLRDLDGGGARDPSVSRTRLAVRWAGDTLVVSN